MFRRGNDNSITGPHIVEQEVAERMKGLASQRRRDGKCAAIDLCAGGRRGQGSHVADRATDLVKQPRPLRRRRCCCQGDMGGAFAARIKRAKWSISASPSGPGVSFGSEAVLHSLVTSSGNSAVVIPISFR